MLLHGWSIALMVLAACVMSAAAIGAVSAVRVLRWWDFRQDTERQIRLESEVLLVSSLMQFGLVMQVFGLFLLVLAADQFAGQLVGAMCASGTLAANDAGIPLLLLRLGLMFASGVWLVLHSLDRQSPEYPLVRVKSWYLLLLLPFLLADGVLLVSFLAGLEPDVLTSCCGVLFRGNGSDGYNLLGPLAEPVLLPMHYLLAAILLVYPTTIGSQGRWWRAVLSLACWLVFGWLALVSVTVFFSPYIYALPAHRCPFDILKPEYGVIGYAIYLSLFLGLFSGIGGSVVALLEPRLSDLQLTLSRSRLQAAWASRLLLVAYLLATAYAPLRYLLGGGES